MTDVDPDALVQPPPSRAVHLSWRYLGLVAAGGTVGTALREALSYTLPRLDGVNVAIVGINLVGAFALGILLESLARRGPDEGGRRVIRLLVGTGVLGGFTTYSTLANDTGALFTGGRADAAIAYALVTLLIGALASFAGIAVGVAVHRRYVKRLRRDGQPDDGRPDHERPDSGRPSDGRGAA